MNPNPRHPTRSWAPAARSTRLQAEYVFGNPERGADLADGLELDNLNATLWRHPFGRNSVIKREDDLRATASVNSRCPQEMA